MFDARASNVIICKRKIYDIWNWVLRRNSFELMDKNIQTHKYFKCEFIGGPLQRYFVKFIHFCLEFNE